MVVVHCSCISLTYLILLPLHGINCISVSETQTTPYTLSFFNISLSNFRTTCILQPPDLYKHIQNISSSSFVEALAYDSVWALALGLNMTVNMINNNDTLDCGQSPVPLEQFTYGNSSTSCFIRHSLSRTNFTGVSVSCWI